MYVEARDGNGQMNLDTASSVAPFLLYLYFSTCWCSICMAETCSKK